MTLVNTYKTGALSGALCCALSSALSRALSLCAPVCRREKRFLCHNCDIGNVAGVHLFCPVNFLQKIIIEI
jgi:hypothetical protein